MAAIRFGLYADLIILFGLPLFALYALRGHESAGTALRLRSLVAPAAALGAVLSALGLAALAASMSGVALFDVEFATVDALLWNTAIGVAALVRIAALFLALLVALLPWRRPDLTSATVAALAGVALGSLAWAGHGAMGEGSVGWIHLIADIVHLLAAGAWLGALAGFALLLFRPAHRMNDEHVTLSHRALAEFSGVGSIAVALIVLTGIVNGWVLVGPGNLASLPTTPYGQLLIVKIVIFVGMLGLAAANRFRLTPALAESLECGDHAGSLAALRRSLALEAAAGAAILALVAVLGLLSPLPAM